MDNKCDMTIDKTETLLANIRNTIIEYYRRSGLMQKAISARTGIKPSQLCLLLKGKRAIFADELVLLIAVLEIPLQEIFGADLWREYHLRMQAQRARTL